MYNRDSQTHTPQCMWAETKEFIFLTVQVMSPQELEVELKETSLDVKCVSEGTKFHCHLDFPHPINVEVRQICSPLVHLSIYICAIHVFLYIYVYLLCVSSVSIDIYRHMCFLWRRYPSISTCALISRSSIPYFALFSVFFIAS